MQDALMQKNGQLESLKFYPDDVKISLLTLENMAQQRSYPNRLALSSKSADLTHRRHSLGYILQRIVRGSLRRVKPTAPPLTDRC